MVDLCVISPLNCLNNGQCRINITSNTTYCQCDQCYEGTFCESVVWKQAQFDTTYIYLILFIIGLCLSILNNSLALDLFLRIRIRQTNCGVYLIVYSILSLISNVLLVVDYAKEYYHQKQSESNQETLEAFHCYVAKIGYNTLIYMCIWFSSCVTFERALVVCFNRNMISNRWQSLITIIVIFTVAVASATPFFVYKCDWNHKSNLLSLRLFFIWFYIVTGIVIYVLATLLILVSFTLRIRRYGTENGSCVKTFLKLLYTHLFIFVPPVAYGIGFIPYTIAINAKDNKHSYFQCGISTGEYVIKVMVEMLQSTPFAMTWLLFIYPSKVYMTEFYVTTWSGRYVAKMLLCFKACQNRKKTTSAPTTNITYV